MPHGYVFYILVILVVMTGIILGVYIHIGVRLRVARFDGQAMREPLECGASNK